MILLIPVATFVSVLLLGMMVQAQHSGQAGVRQAELEAEQAKMLLRASIIRGRSNETLLNLYGAGKLPIVIDYILVELLNGTVLVEKSGEIITVGPGENMTVPVSALDQRLAAYDGDFWKMRREVKQLIIHSSDGGLFYIGWGPLYSSRAVVILGNNTVTTSTSTTTQTTTSTSYSTSTSTVTVTTTPRTYIIYTTVTYYRQITVWTTLPQCYFQCYGVTTVWYPYVTRWTGPTVTTTIGPYTQPFVLVTSTVSTVIRTATPETVTGYLFNCNNPSCTGGIYYVEATFTTTSSTTFTTTITLTASG